MSFSWANKFAKSALLSAQKHIDSVLDIKDEDDTPECSVETEYSEYDDDNQTKEEAKCLSSKTRHDSSRFDDVELNVDTSQLSNWSTQFEQKNTPVVDAEPNPIRDAHEDAITPLNYSPTSNTNTPEEEEENVEETQIHPASAAVNSSFDLSFINENSQRSNSLHSGSEDTHEHDKDTNLEDVHTIVSSDIEIVKQLDDWSVSSGNHWRNMNDTNVVAAHILPDGEVVNPLVSECVTGNTPNEKTLHLAANATQTSNNNDEEFLSRKNWASEEQTSQTQLTHRQSGDDDGGNWGESIVSDELAVNEKLAERVAVLEAKLRHKDQQMEEVVKQNEKLRTSNVNLAAKNRQFAMRSLTESKLQKTLVEKEKELNDLMEEGKRLSEHCGKQAKELRKLKQQNSQLEAVEAARDSALHELQSTHSTLQERIREVEELKENIKKIEAKASHLKTEADLNRASTDIVEKFMNEKNAELETLNKDLAQTRREFKDAQTLNTKLSEELQILKVKLLNKRAHDSAENDREKGEHEDLMAQTARNSALNAQIRQLESKIETLVNSQHDIASQIFEANMPLLDNISCLEEKICTLERQNETLNAQLRDANESFKYHEREADLQLRIVAKRLDEEHNLNLSREAEISSLTAENRNLKNAAEKTDQELRVLKADNAKKCRMADEKNFQLAEELRSQVQNYEKLERQYSDLLKSSIKFSSNEKQSPQREARSAQLEIVEEEADEKDLDDNKRNSISKLETDQEETEFLSFDDYALKEAKIDDVNMMNASKTINKEQGARKFDSLDFKTSPPFYLQTPQHHSVSVEFLRAELEDAHAQLYQLREKFDRLLELYGGCLETIDELKYDNEDLRKLCKEQALELAGLKSG